MIAVVVLAVAAGRRLRSGNRVAGAASGGTPDAPGAYGRARPPDWGNRLRSRARSQIRRRPVTTFLLLAFAGMWVPLSATLALGLPLRLTSAVGAMVGLTLPALVVTGVTQGRPAVRMLVRRSLVPTPRPFAFTVALIAIPLTTVTLAIALDPEAGPSVTDVGHVATRYAIDLLVALVTIQIAEEVGWTGLAQDLLQKRHGALLAAALVAPAFAAIHLPTYLVGAPVTPTALAGALVGLVPITVFAVALRVLIAWSYNAANGCVLAAAVTHASFNTTSGDELLHRLGSGPEVAFLPLVAVVVLAAVVTTARRWTRPGAAPHPIQGRWQFQARRPAPAECVTDHNGSAKPLRRTPTRARTRRDRNGRGDPMAPEATRETPRPQITMELLEPAAMRALLDDDLAEASRICGRQLPSFFLEEAWLWRIRFDQIRTSPEDAPWLVRVVALEPSGVVIGHAGFHGRPDAAGAVEIAYTVAPEHRGNGYAHAVLAALVEEARTHPDVNLVRATVSPDNGPSLAVIRRGGFVHVGEQWDDVDGRELVFEKNLDAARERSSVTDPREVRSPGRAC